MDNFSPNMLKTFNQCPKKFELKYIQKISAPQKSTPFEKGKKIHALANYYLKGEDISKLEKNLTAEELTIWQKLKENEYLKKTYINSEYNISCKVGKYWIGGRLDALVKDENQYYVLDYKTGSIPQNPEFDFQTIVYLLASHKLLKEKVSFVYIDLKNNTNYKIDLSDIADYENRITQICDKINLTNEFAKSSECKFCEYINLPTCRH